MASGRGWVLPAIVPQLAQANGARQPMVQDSDGWAFCMGWRIMSSDMGGRETATYLGAAA